MNTVYIGDGPLDLMIKIAISYTQRDRKVILLTTSKINYTYLRFAQILNKLPFRINYIDLSLSNINCEITSDLGKICSRSLKYYDVIKVNKGMPKKSLTRLVFKANKNIDIFFDKISVEDSSTFILWNNVSFLNNFIWLHFNSTHKVAILENGFERPNTLFLDFFGTNKESGFYNYYEAAPIQNYIKRTKKSDICSYHIKLLAPFTIFAYLLSFYCTDDYSKLYFSKMDDLKIRLSKLKLLKKKEEVILKNKYIFLALQLDDDSQTIFFGNDYFQISAIEKAVEILNQLKKLDPEIGLIVKVHPLNKYRINIASLKKRYESKDIKFVIDFPLNDLIKRSIFVMTINSTVGYESIKLNTPVVVFGQAIYFKNNVSINISMLYEMIQLSENFSEFSAMLSGYLTECESFIKKMSSYLINFNLNSPTGDELNHLVERIDCFNK
jgi:hypothetical protein